MWAPCVPSCRAGRWTHLIFTSRHPERARLVGKHCCWFAPATSSARGGLRKFRETHRGRFLRGVCVGGGGSTGSRPLRHQSGRTADSHRSAPKRGASPLALGSEGAKPNSDGAEKRHNLPPFGRARLGRSRAELCRISLKHGGADVAPEWVGLAPNLIEPALNSVEPALSQAEAR